MRGVEQAHADSISSATIAAAAAAKAVAGEAIARAWKATVEENEVEVVVAARRKARRASVHVMHARTPPQAA
jgi:hypothetical protein